MTGYYHAGNCDGQEYCCLTGTNLRCDSGRSECTKTLSDGTISFYAAKPFAQGKCGGSPYSPPSPPPSPAPSPSPPSPSPSSGPACAFVGCPDEDEVGGATDAWAQSLTMCRDVNIGRCPQCEGDIDTLTQDCRNCLMAHGCANAENYDSCIKCRSDNPNSIYQSCYDTGNCDTDYKKPIVVKGIDSDACDSLFNDSCFTDSTSLYQELDAPFSNALYQCMDNALSDDCSKKCGATMDSPMFLTKNCQSCMRKNIKKNKYCSGTDADHYAAQFGCNACLMNENDDYTECGTICGQPPTPGSSKHKGSDFPWWGWLLVGLGALLFVGLLLAGIVGLIKREKIKQVAATGRQRLTQQYRRFLDRYP